MAPPTKKMKTTEVAKELQKKEISDIWQKKEAFLKNRKEANNVLDIILSLESSNDNVVAASISCLCSIFTTLFHSKEMRMIRLPTEYEELLDRTAEETYKMWVRERYADTVARFSEILVGHNPNLQKMALESLMTFLHLEAKYPDVTLEKGEYYFAASLFESVAFALFSDTENMAALVTSFEKYIDCEDIKYYTMKALITKLESTSKWENKDIFLTNCFAVLERIKMKPGSKDRVLKTYCYKGIRQSPKLEFKAKNMKTVFDAVWLAFLRMKLNMRTRRRVLAMLHDNVMPHLTYPLILTDFYMDSYSFGGAMSLLALNGIFVLMHKHNLEFPDFFKNLYSLIVPELFHSKHVSSFFKLIDIIFQSTHLPEYIVSAFVKKLCRISLTAPPHCLRLVLPFIRNLMFRHPSLLKMIHNPDRSSEQLLADPFDDNEPNPMNCKALESSLWELKTLEQHYCPAVSNAASYVHKKLPEMESDISELLSLSMTDLITAEVSRNKPEFPLNAEKPLGLFSGNGDVMSQFWTF